MVHQEAHDRATMVGYLDGIVHKRTNLDTVYLMKQKQQPTLYIIRRLQADNEIVSECVE